MGKEALLCIGTLPISIFPSATALEVFDMLEGVGNCLLTTKGVAKMQLIL